MPELPEVETIKRVLEPQLQGLTIDNVVINRPEVVAHPHGDEFCKLLTGQAFDRIERRGKFLLLLLNSGDRIIIHLRMTGCLLHTPADLPKEKHTHIVFRLNDGKDLRFSDTRRFGRLWLVKKNEIDIYSGIERLGKEPLDSDFSAGYLIAHLGKRKKAIKECLLDQRVIAGIGNIYADEILFAAKINPARPANSLSEKDWMCLAQVIPQQLSYFIEKNEMTPAEYLETKGQNYRNTPFLQVYGRQGEACPACNHTLCRMVIGGRSSTHCPACQK
ncbi:DNA-formamidopyrimidine glycosylase [Christensenellaceae bacterium NSJ-44]|uniref:Formamidopyrimidine-DNA glycosylase n=1 Tax=Luoshenia tenuis TaxID=2763654 RepID=A0A926CY69_9FIRM|nr:DNA-formamidopyrimidine glycosylase [Luoshenia tenuis]MBC8528880.1 DNA-formamidopyrimidine glycosylase [Luoshenia tenuis]